MAEEQSTPEISERQRIILAEAKKAAKARGLHWGSLERDERKRLRIQARAELIAQKRLPPEPGGKSSAV